MVAENLPTWKITMKIIIRLKKEKLYVIKLIFLISDISKIKRYLGYCISWGLIKNYFKTQTLFWIGIFQTVPIFCI